ncbi:TonB-dependent receptor domain-containing protein [Sphingomonas sp. AX6]|uniref:TonB-dependent receptor domain-containing protein n=1 Tax=Sphingomonas sp. AX6 TaxID=2653171 RepID=UPI0012F0498E|nr:TonB-dependent receptor [Sphingomonas sp. AX6]VXC86959.1 TonB-dependent receptor [Sphingomonas sp. AX6]
MRISKLLSATALASAAFALPQVAWAQTTTDAQNTEELTTETEIQSGEPDEQDSAGSIVVTGSRIRAPNLTSVNPITSIGGETIFQSAGTNIGDTLNDLPQLSSTFSQQNPGLGIGIAGLNLLDLRGLGTVRTLVLVNGRRHVPADILNNASSPDISTIPNDLIQSVDIVTGGNSAVYGSDAIAGVVNFVLRTDFEGLQVRGTANIAEAGFGGNQYVSAMFGKNFADGRGNITVHGEYNRQDRVFASDVPWFRRNDGFVTVDADSGGLANNSDGFPDAIFLRDIRQGTISPFGLVAVGQSTANAACGRGTTPNAGAPNNAGAAFNCNFVFNPDGTLVPQTGTRVGSGPLGTFLGGNGTTGREGQTLSVLPFLERYNANLLGRFEFSEAAEAFVEAKFARVNALGNNAGPSFIQGTLGTTDIRERARLDNPFLSAQARGVLTQAILASGQTAVLVGSTPLTAADRAAIADGSYRFSVARSLLDVGIRDERFQRDTYRVVAGLRGTFWDDFSYEISGNYGKFEQETITDGFIDRQRFALAMDAGRNPVTGQIQCRSQFDPASAVRLNGFAAPAAANQARLAADIAACVPYNPFGQADNSASVNYFANSFTANASIEQKVVQGFVSGSLGRLFELPGGPIRFSVGAEYREEEAFYKQDQFVVDGFTNGVSIPQIGPVGFDVKEAYGELQIPLLANTPFFEELTLSGAARVSDYSGSTGTVWAYNAGVIWSPIRGLRLRGNYGRAVRAPTVAETGSSLVPNFAPGFTDPCAPNQINTSANRAANCQADLGGLLANIDQVTYSLPVLSGSNPNLEAETSDSYTVGAVFTPAAIPGLSLSVDYYNITVNGVIVSLAAQTIANSCYDQPTLNNVFCTQFQRYRGTGPGPNNEVAGDILGNTLIQAPLNFAKREREGIDVNAAYRTNISDDVRLGANLVYTHNLKNSNFESATDPNFENRILGETGFPTDEFRLDIDVGFREFTLGYRLRYIGSQLLTTYESFNELNGQPAGNLDAFSPTKYPDITYSDLRFEWDIEDAAGLGKELQFYVGVDNVFNKLPPLGTTATGGGTAIFDYRGRAYYSGFRARF